MNVVTRGARNAFRNSVRTFSIVSILSLSIGLTLAMLVARAAVQEKIALVKSSIGNTVSISPAGTQGFQGGGEPLTTAELAKVAKVTHVTATVQLLSDRLTTANTTLQSAIEAGSLGRRGADNSGVGFQVTPDGNGRVNDEAGAPDGAAGSNNMSDNPAITRTFTPPVIVTGTSDATATTVFSGNTATFTSGKALDASKDEDVGIIGKSIADKNSLKVGSTFTAYGKAITVVGIYDTGNTFANNGVVMPLAALQRLSSQAGAITSATVTVDSLDNVVKATTDIQTALGDAADVTNNQEIADAAVHPLESVKTIATFSLIGAVAAGAVIILLTMVMIVRERRREIGVFKAIGASNAKIMLQFISESVTLTLLGMVAGVVIGAASASPLTNALVSSSANSTSTSQGPSGFGQFSTQTSEGNAPRRLAPPASGGPRNFTNNALSGVRSVKASVGVSIIAYGFLAALAIAILGSALPAFFIAKIRPAEVMRAE